MTFYWGVIRISNPVTLQRWIDKGLFKAQLDDGYHFAPGCGRFTLVNPCTCSKCRNMDKSTKAQALIQVLKDNNYVTENSL